MRFKWEVFFTCASAAVLGAISGLMVGALLFVLLAQDEKPVLASIFLGGGVLVGAVIGWGYCRSLIRKSPDEWISPQLNKQFCTSCMYDLTQNTSGLCPECGKPIAEQQQPFIENDSEPPHA
jgi:hypothetical protein